MFAFTLFPIVVSASGGTKEAAVAKQLSAPLNDSIIDYTMAKCEGFISFDFSENEKERMPRKMKLEKMCNLLVFIECIALASYSITMIM